MSKSKSKYIAPRVPEGEGIDDQEDLSIEELNLEFKKRMKEYHNFVKFFLNELGLKDNSKILEIGPGPAWITIIMAQENPTLDITGLEISNDMIRVAKQNIKQENVQQRINIIQGNAENMSMLDNNSFDAVITHDSLHHWENPIKILDEIARVLKKDAVFCIGDGRRDIGIGAKIIFQIAKLFISKQMSYWWKQSINAGYTPDEIRVILDQTDLKGKYEIKADLFDLLIHNKYIWG